MKLSLAAAILALMCTPAAFSATAVTDDSVSSSESAPMVTTKYHNYDSDLKSGVSRVTPVTGFEISNFVGDGALGWKDKVGAVIGATIDVGYSDVVFETGLLFKQMGATTNGSSSTYSSDNTYYYSSSNNQFNLNYLAVPIGFKWYIGGQEGSTVFFKAGVLPQALVSKSQTTDYYWTYNSTNTNFPDVNSFDLEAYAGLGGKVAVNEKIDIMFDGTYTRGFTKVNNDSGSSIFNSGFALTAGVGFNL